MLYKWRIKNAFTYKVLLCLKYFRMLFFYILKSIFLYFIYEIFNYFLIKFPENNVKLGGFLLCLYSVKKEKEEEDLFHQPINFPRPPQFKFISACENVNSKLRSRWCLVYKRIEQKE